MILRNIPDVELVGVAKNSKELFTLLRKNQCDIILLDINLPGRDGIDILMEIKNNNPITRIIMLSNYEDIIFVLKSLSNGASGYINKDLDEIKLNEAIKTVLDGNIYMDKDLAAKIIINIATERNAIAKHDCLSPREIKVMLEIGKSRSLTDIANDMNLSIKTISTYKTRLLKKLGLRNNMEITNYLIENKLL